VWIVWNDSLDKLVNTSSAIHRILGIDYGSKRIGLALSDPLGIIAHPIAALLNTPAFLTSLQKVVQQEKVQLLVVGMPYNLKGEQAQKAEEVKLFIDDLKKALNLEVLTWDERFTTTIAHQSMLAMGMKKKDRQKKDGTVDSMAAAIMLQGFLDSTKYSCSC
jgi:putative holliday junction resolvase